MPSAKRKHLSSESSSDNDESSFRALQDAAPSKRQRYTTLENGFARLAVRQKTPPLMSVVRTPTQPNNAVIELDSILGPRPVSPMPVDSEPNIILLPGSVEEPVSPDLSGNPPSEGGLVDVKMHSQSWYEPEKDRIIITDLDDSSDEETDSNCMSEAQGISISVALLERIKNQPKFIPALPSRDTSNAVVLFRPLLSSPNTSITESANPAPFVQKDDDAMDVEI